MTRSLHVAVCGAASLVGREILSILFERGFSCASVLALDDSSNNNVGERVAFGETEFGVKAMSADSFDGIDLAFFAADPVASQQFSPIAQAKGCVVIDLSAAWRYDTRCPMVAAPINLEDVSAHNGIISCPSSSSLQLAAVFRHLHKAGIITQATVTSLEAVGDSGQEGIDELERQVRQLFNMQQPQAQLYPHQVAFNCLPHVGAFLQDDSTDQEHSLAAEVSKLLGQDIPMAVTCVRVPVFYGHSQAVTVVLEKSMSAADVRILLMEDSSIQVVDNPRANLYPLACDATGEDEIFVGRIRSIAGLDNALGFWIVADNVRRGAALNAVQIAEELLRLDRVSIASPGMFLPM